MKSFVVSIVAGLLTLMTMASSTVAPASASLPWEEQGVTKAGTSVCRQVGDDHLFACADAEVVARRVSCGYATDADWACTVEYALTLSVVGGELSCDSARIEPTGKLVACSTFFVPGANAITRTQTYSGVPFHGRTVFEPGEVCVDVVSILVIEPECKFFPVLVRLPGPTYGPLDAEHRACTVGVNPVDAGCVKGVVHASEPVCDGSGAEYHCDVTFDLEAEDVGGVCGTLEIDQAPHENLGTFCSLSTVGTGSAYRNLFTVTYTDIPPQGRPVVVWATVCAWGTSQGLDRPDDPTCERWNPTTIWLPG